MIVNSKKDSLLSIYLDDGHKKKTGEVRYHCSLNTAHLFSLTLDELRELRSVVNALVNAEDTYCIRISGCCC